MRASLPLGTLFSGALCAVALGACGDGAPQASSQAPASPPEPRPIVVTRDNTELPDGCRPGQAAELVSEFLAAFNRGDTRAALAIADPLAGPRDTRPRGWFSVTDGERGGGKRHFVAYRRGKLGRYFARRHRRGERMELIELVVHHGSATGVAGISYRIDRRARDFRARGITNTVATGKGTVKCERGKIFVWSMGMAPRRPLGRRQCPLPPERGRRQTVACSARGA